MGLPWADTSQVRDRSSALHAKSAMNFGYPASSTPPLPGDFGIHRQGQDMDMQFIAQHPFGQGQARQALFSVGDQGRKRKFIIRADVGLPVFKGGKDRQAAAGIDFHRVQDFGRQMRAHSGGGRGVKGGHGRVVVIKNRQFDVIFRVECAAKSLQKMFHALNRLAAWVFLLIFRYEWPCLDGDYRLPVQALFDKIQSARDGAAEDGPQVLRVPEAPFLEMMLGIPVAAQRLNAV